MNITSNFTPHFELIDNECVSKTIKRTKTCYRCKIEHDISKFDYTSRGELYKTCKSCLKALNDKIKTTKSSKMCDHGVYSYNCQICKINSVHNVVLLTETQEIPEVPEIPELPKFSSSTNPIIELI